MRRLRFLGFLLLSTLVAAGSTAQNSSNKDKPLTRFEYNDEKPVWTLEYLEVKPGMFGPAMGYLDDNWMRVREQAKHDGTVLAYHRIAEQTSDKGGWNVVLITEFKSQEARDASEKRFHAILKGFPQNTSSEVIRGFTPAELFQSLSTRTFQDFSDSSNPQFRLLSKM